MGAGWMLKQQTPSQLVFWKDNSSTLQNAFLGSRYDSTTTHEIRLVFSNTASGSVRVFGQIALLTNEGSAFEQRTDLTGGAAGHQLWQGLRSVEEQFAQRSSGLAQAAGQPSSPGTGAPNGTDAPQAATSASISAAPEPRSQLARDHARRRAGSRTD